MFLTKNIYQPTFSDCNSNKRKTKERSHPKNILFSPYCIPYLPWEPGQTAFFITYFTQIFVFLESLCNFKERAFFRCFLCTHFTFSWVLSSTISWGEGPQIMETTNWLFHNSRDLYTIGYLRLRTPRSLFIFNTLNLDPPDLGWFGLELENVLNRLQDGFCRRT